MKVEKLGENLYKVKLSFWSWSWSKGLAEALLNIQTQGKVITSVSRLPYTVRFAFLICTTDN